MANASTLAELAKKAANGSKDLQLLINAAGVIVAASSALLKEAQPILDSIDTDAIAEKTRLAARTAGEQAGKAGIAVKGAASGATGMVGDVLAKLGNTKDGILADLSEAKSEKELKRAIKDARQSVLENATTSITIADFLKAVEKSSSAPLTPISDMPGCFVLATYKKLDFDKDLTDYTGIFVGKADDTSVGVLTAISRDGDPDVYADVKFKQNVHAFVFNCRAEDLEERYFSLCQTFADDRLYDAQF